MLNYAEAGNGRRASVYTDYTVAVWSRPPVDAAEAASVVEAIRRREPARPDGLQLVAFANAHSGLSHAQLAPADNDIAPTPSETLGPRPPLAPHTVLEHGL